MASYGYVSPATQGVKRNSLGKALSVWGFKPQSRIRRTVANQNANKPKPAATPQQAQTPSMPFDPTYQGTIANINRGEVDSEAGLGQQELNTKLQYGFDNSLDPFSVSANLNRQYGQRRNSTLNSYAAQGQLYSGALSNARESDRLGYDQSVDSAKKAYQSALDDISNRRTSLRSQAEQQRLDAGGDAAARASAAELDPAAVPPSPVTASHQLGTLGWFTNPKTGQQFQIVNSGGRVVHVYRDGHRVRVK